MLFQKCPSKDSLLEYVSISTELSLWKRVSVRSHSVSCTHCREQIQNLQEMWANCLTPEPDVTTSVMRVFSRLQKDETLVLKGWKLDAVVRRRSASTVLLNGGWLFRGGVSVGIAALVVFLLIGQLRGPADSVPMAVNNLSLVPLAKIRVEDKNRVQVHYVQPELLQSIEFETTGVSR